jgi:benzodiazapine receptor
MKNVLALAAFIILVLGGGTLIGLTNMPGPWYEGLQKPWFNPPNWVFGPAWTLLYILIAVAGWRIWGIGPARTARLLWIVQLVLNFAWTPVFFGLRQPGVALVVVLALLAANIAFIVAAWRHDRMAALLFVPYVAWVAFATLLNAVIVVLN